MKMDRFPLAAVVLLLSACGGGSRGDSFNSSFNGTVNLNGTRYECPSQKTMMLVTILVIGIVQDVLQIQIIMGLQLPQFVVLSPLPLMVI